MASNQRLESALRLAELGFYVFPIRTRGKKPAHKKWQENATREPGAITNWFHGHAYNVGVFTSRFGEHHAALVVDVDNKADKRGDDELLRLELEGKDLPPTLTQYTPTGGRHLVYSVAKPVKQGANVLAPGLDIRSRGGYVVGAGSVLASGVYTCDWAPIVPAPRWLIDACGHPLERESVDVDLSLVDKDRACRRAREYLEAAPASVEGQGGDQNAYVVACRVKDFGVDQDTCLELLLDHWNDRCTPPWGVDALTEKVRNAYRYGKEPAGAAAPEVQFPPVESDPSPMPAYKRRGNHGAIVSCISNVIKALQRPDQCGARLGWDEFRGEIMIAPADTEEWRALTDSHYTKLRNRLEHMGFDPVSKELVRDAALEVAEVNLFDSAAMWLEGLQWDGTPRAERFFADYYGAPDGEYARAVSLYWWTGLAGRVLAPPCQCDMTVVITGAQGIGKTQGARAMVPAPEHFVEIDLGTRDDDLARSMRGTLVGEIGELRGLYSRDSEALKQWVSRMTERWVPKYKEFTATYHRRLMLLATTNADAFLADETGERRWLPLRSSGVKLDDIRRDRDQLWAEGAELFRRHGVMWKDAARLAADHHADYKLGDAWEDAITEWLGATVQPADDTGRATGAKYIRCERPFRMAELLTGALGLSTPSHTKPNEMRAARVLRSLGYRQDRLSLDGKQVRAWHRLH